jgi:hypothetical protein
MYSDGVTLARHPVPSERVEPSTDPPRTTNLEGTSATVKWQSTAHTVGPLEVALNRGSTRAGNGKHYAGRFGLVLDGLDDYFDQYAQSRVRLPDGTSKFYGRDADYSPFQTLPTALASRPVGCPGRTARALASIALGKQAYNPDRLKLVDCGAAPPVMHAPGENRAVLAVSRRFGHRDDDVTPQDAPQTCPETGYTINDRVSLVGDGVDVLMPILEEQLDVALGQYRRRDGEDHVFATEDNGEVVVTGRELATAGQMTTDIASLEGSHTVSAGVGSNAVQRTIEIGQTDLSYSYGDDAYVQLHPETVIGARLAVTDPSHVTTNSDAFSVAVEYLLLREDANEYSENRAFDIKTVQDTIATFDDADIGTTVAHLSG